jgi:Reverse transcriptase (RNA-dependent DNA polymerase)
METIRLLISQAAQNEWRVHQIDVKSAFLIGVLEEEMYVEQSLGYMKLGKEHKVLRLKNALYGLKQAPRGWNTRIYSYFKKNGFKQCPFEAAIYVKVRKDEILIVTLYVNDLIFIGNSQRLIDEFKREMKLEFEMTDLRMMSYFLGLEIKQKKSGIFVSQVAYVREILQKFGMSDCNPIATPMELGAKLSKLEVGEAVDSNTYRSMIDSLRYLTCTRPDIAFVVGIASRFMEDPKNPHLKVVKRILRYVKRAEDLGLFYQNTNIFELPSYVDSDWCGDIVLS